MIECALVNIHAKTSRNISLGNNPCDAYHSHHITPRCKKPGPQASRINQTPPHHQYLRAGRLQYAELFVCGLEAAQARV